MDTRRLQYLDAMGIQAWVRRDSAVPRRDEVRDTGSEEKPPSPRVPASYMSGVANDVAALDWTALQQRVQNCTLCTELAASRTQTVFGVGDRQAQWLVVGEAPGADEDVQGEPFVGRAGQLLNAMLHAIGLQRGQVYIANVLKCRPPNNRDPRAEEAANCEPYLQRQIALIQPRLILVVGRIAAQSLLKTDTPIGKLRGRVHRYGDIPMVVTYHPAYLLRSPGEKRKAWDDLRLAVATMQGDGT